MFFSSLKNVATEDGDLLPHLFYLNNLLRLYMVEIFQFLKILCKELCGILTYMEDADGKEEFRESSMLRSFDRIDKILGRFFGKSRQYEKVFFFNV